MIRPVTLADAHAVCEIYNDYIVHTPVTFEETAVDAAAMAERIREVTREYPWLVYEEDGRVVGYTYAKRWKERSAYRYAVETATYLSADRVGKGIGSKLKAALLQELRNRSIHSVICAITLPNPASIALNEKFGFEKVAHLKEVGFKLNRWIDVGYWQLILR